MDNPFLKWATEHLKETEVFLGVVDPGNRKCAARNFVGRYDGRIWQTQPAQGHRRGCIVGLGEVTYYPGRTFLRTRNVGHTWRLLVVLPFIHPTDSLGHSANGSHRDGAVLCGAANEEASRNSTQRIPIP
ncbi:MAG: hypothetical protein ACR2IV_03290 [Bryobacteraceae bacterium]